jgi:hypothetical protein
VAVLVSRCFGGLLICQAGWIITHIVPDRHDQNHGPLESCVQLGEPANLGEAIAVAESLELVRAELGGDIAAGGDALCCCEYAKSILVITRKVREDFTHGIRWSRDLDCLATLNKELAQLVLLEASHNTYNTTVSLPYSPAAEVQVKLSKKQA